MPESRLKTPMVFYMVLVSLLIHCSLSAAVYFKDSTIDRGVISSVQNDLIQKFGMQQQERIIKGTEQLASIWKPGDGGIAGYMKFARENFLADEELISNFQRISQDLVLLNGSLTKIRSLFNEHNEFTDVPELRVDSFFRKSIPQADLHKSKLVHFIVLNYPYYTLEEKRKKGSGWSREKWAMVRLGDRYKGPRASSKSPYDDEVREFERYMENYFVRMQDVCLPDGTYPFHTETVLHSHRGLRDEIKDEYTKPGGTPRQALLAKVMERIVTGTIPGEFRKDTGTFWNPWTNKLFRSKVGKEIGSAPEGTRRYEGLHAIFMKKRFEDSLLSYTSTFIKRNFDNSNLTVDEVEKLMMDFLKEPILKSVGELIQKKLNRPLQPFDIWYDGFQEQSFFSSSMLDSLVQSKYPGPAAFEKDIPQILERIGFPANEAARLGAKIRVRPIISGGYSKRQALPGDEVTITTMFGKNGMDYKSYRVVFHELGHAVEMLYTAEGVDNFLLADVPSNGITEGIAEFFAYRNIDGLGFRVDKAQQAHLQSLATLWYLYEMAGQALTDIETWKWMYAHPGESPDKLRSAVLSITENIWNTYYAPVFNVKDRHILSIYNHYITGNLYLYNYFYSNVIMFQLYAASRNRNVAEMLKAACREGDTLPELWVQHAVGSPVTLEPLLQASEKALLFFRSAK